MNFLRNFSFFIVLSVPVVAYGYTQILSLDGDIKKDEKTIALRKAAKKGDIKKMQRCIQNGADVNDVEGRSWPHAGRSILTDAIDSSSVEAVELLLKSGAIVEDSAEVPYFLNTLKPLERNFSQLSYALILHASTEIIELLIRYSKDINSASEYYGWTPYKIAAFYKDYRVMALLEKAGADTDTSISELKVLQ